MNKYLKYALISLATLALAFGALLAAVSLLVNPNDYKPLIVKLVKEKKDRTLVLSGNIGLQLFPRLGLDLGPASLSEHGSQNEFAAMKSLKLYVAWMPLLHRSLEIDSIAVGGIRARLVRYPDGKTNFDDFLEQKPGQKSEVKFDIQGLEVADSAISFDDRMAGRKLEVSEFSLKSGRIKDATPTHVETAFTLTVDQPKMATRVSLKSGLLFELDRKHYAFDGIDLIASGAAAGISNIDAALKGSVDQSSDGVSASALKLDFKGNRDGEPIEVKLDAPQIRATGEQVSSGKISALFKKGSLGGTLAIAEMHGSGKAFEAPALSLELNGKVADGSISGKLSAAASGNLESMLLDLKQINASVNLQQPGLPGGKLDAAATGDAHLDFNKQDAAANLKTKLDDSNIQGKIGINNFSTPAYRFDINVDRLDADRYLPKTAKQPGKPAEFDLSALHDLNATGSVKLGALKIANVRAENVRIELKAGNGKLDLNPLAASLYQGSMTGSVSATAAKTPQFGVRETMRGISIGPLLKDATSKDMLDGRGSLTLDVTAMGSSVAALKKNLNGAASTSLVDGAVKGINIAETLRKLKPNLGGAQSSQSQAANSAEKTDFAELRASFRIQNGVAHNDDLSMKSPLLRLGGAGDIDIGNGSMNYLAKVSVVGTLKGQGGAELSELRGLTVPIRLSGPFDSLKYSVDIGAMAQGLVKGRVEQKKEEVKQQLQQKLKGGLKGLF